MSINILSLGFSRDAGGLRSGFGAESSVLECRLFRKMAAKNSGNNRIVEFNGTLKICEI